MVLANPINYASQVDDRPPAAPGDESFAPFLNWKNAWFESAEMTESNNMNTFFSQYKAEGGRPPLMLAIDMEDAAKTYNILQDIGLNANGSACFRAIWNHSKSMFIRARLSQYGVTTVDAAVNPPNGQHWNAEVDKLLAESMRRAYTNVLHRYYREAAVSNYDDFILSPAEGANVLYFSTQPDYKLATMGTHSSPVFYGHMNNAGAIYGTDGFGIMKYETNRFRAMLRSAPGQRMAPWVAYPSASMGGYSADPNGYAYHRELIYHLALCGTESFLYWNAGATAGDETAWHSYLVDLQNRLGSGARASVDSSLVALSAETVVSGTSIGQGGYLWRCSVKPNVTSVSANGSALAVANGERGVWLQTSAPTMPSFTVS
jgi:hypothetical protein